MKNQPPPKQSPRSDETVHFDETVSESASPHSVSNQPVSHQQSDDSHQQSPDANATVDFSNNQTVGYNEYASLPADATGLYTPGSDSVSDGADSTRDTMEHHPTTPNTTAGKNKKATSSNEGDFSFTPASSAGAVRSVADPKLASEKDRIPKTIGAYTIERVLGRGGMGIVYKAFQTKLGRPVALKMVLSGSHVSDQVLVRFIAEAKAVAHLQHPNIVQIFEVGEHDGLPFFSLEYVNGPPLDKKLEGKPIPSEEAAKLTMVLCEAMQYAHDNGVLHRDLKPANVMTTSEGSLKVTDFGLAKRLEEETDSSSTREGTIMGTPSYMSPEQARGAIHELGPATDQYSLGAMLYEFLTGRPPFAAPKPFETIMQVIKNEPIAPKQLQSKIPDDLETICLKALQKDISKRYSSCADMAADLRRFLNGEPILARPVGNVERAYRWYRRNPVVGNLSAAALLGLIGVAGVSTYSAITLSEKNSQLEKSKSQTEEQAKIARENEALARTHEAQALVNEGKALEQEKIAQRRADSIVDTVQKFFREVEEVDVNALPRIKEKRDRMMKLLLPILEQEVLKEMPTDDKAVLTAAALRKTVADNMAAQNMKESAEKYYIELEEFFRNRATVKKTDSARNNYASMVRSLAELKRELDRNMDGSLALYKKQLEIAEDVFANSRGDEKGEGKYNPFQKLQLLARAHHELGTTYFRIGMLQEAISHADEGVRCNREAIAAYDVDEKVLALPEGVRQRQRRALQDQLDLIELAQTMVKSQLGDDDVAEPVLRKTVAAAKLAKEADITNASILRDYCGKLGLLAEFLARNGKTEEALGMFQDAAKEGDRLLSFAPDHTEFLRTSAMAHYRLAQWNHELGNADWEKSAQRALEIRRAKHAMDKNNDRFKIELMLSEAQTGDAAKADVLAGELLELPNVDNELLVEIARSYAMIASRDSDASEKHSHLEKAKALINRAIQQNYRDRLYLIEEVDLRPMRDSGIMDEVIAGMPSA
jgi:serine/threonine protein kinase